MCVHEVNADSPLAGRVLPGDVVLALDGDDCSSMGMEALVALITSRKDAPERVFKLRREEADANAGAPGADGGTVDDANAGAPGADGGTVDAEVGAPPSAELDDATKQEGEGHKEEPPAAQQTTVPTALLRAWQKWARLTWPDRTRPSYVSLSGHVVRAWLTFPIYGGSSDELDAPEFVTTGNRQVALENDLHMKLGPSLDVPLREITEADLDGMHDLSFTKVVLYFSASEMQQGQAVPFASKYLRIPERADKRYSKLLSLARLRSLRAPKQLNAVESEADDSPVRPSFGAVVLKEVATHADERSDDPDGSSILLTGHWRTDACRKLVMNKAFKYFFVTLTIVGCGVAICEQLSRSNRSAWLVWRALDLLIASIFAVEIALTCIAFGFLQPLGDYPPFAHSRWNQLDLAVSLAMFGYRIGERRAPLFGTPFPIGAAFCALLRSLRPLRLVRLLPAVRKILQALINALSALSTLLGVMFLFWLGCTCSRAGRRVCLFAC